jgi:hypothetical protein
MNTQDDAPLAQGNKYPSYENDQGTVDGLLLILYYVYMYCCLSIEPFALVQMEYLIVSLSLLFLELLSQFIRHHTILVEQDDEDNDTTNNEDDDDMIPTADDAHVRRVSCYMPLLQRIRNRAYYTDEELRRSSANSNTSTFVVEVPLSELTSFSHQNNAAQYPELVARHGQCLALSGYSVYRH